jgi:methylenetetrahydrofolate reductase (NADPH)
MAACLPLLNGYSIEITGKDSARLEEARPFLADGCVVSITFLPGDDVDHLAEVAQQVRQLGLTPQPHISARRLESEAHLRRFLGALASRAAVDRVFVVAGDLASPAGPYSDSLAVIETGLFASFGVRTVGVAGHPEGHPRIPGPVLWSSLRRKWERLLELGHEPEIVTQFAFSADPEVTWLAELRAAGYGGEVRIGVAGPTSPQSLVRFAARCGVSASTKVLARYGVSLGRLFDTATPDLLLQELSMKLGPEAERVRAHIYPFGGVRRAAAWAARRWSPDR